MSAIIKTTVFTVFQLLENAKKKHRLYLTPINSVANIVCVKKGGFQFRSKGRHKLSEVCF